MRYFNPLNILVVLQPGLGLPDEYAELIKQRFPEKVKNGEIRIRLLQDGSVNAIPDEYLDTHIIGTGVIVERIPEMKDLQWVMTFSAGYDHWEKWGRLPAHIPLLNLPGGSGIPIAEFVLGLMLNLSKKYTLMWDNQKERRFIRIRGEELYGKTLGIVGLGGIGRQIAKRAKAFDMRVIGTEIQKLNIPFVDEVYLSSQVDEVIAQSDFLVLACPETSETVGMMNERTFKLMKESAYLINCARGSLVIKEDLMKALNEGWIAGAANDTQWIKKPLPSFLPSDDEVWDTKGLLITPHVSSWTDMYAPRFGGAFVENIDRYLQGLPLTNVVPGFDANIA
ncbi:MAG: NAD(P)-dependent oxidoreductase [Bacillota bacterium]